MASLQKIALFIFFDAIENDLISRIRDLSEFQEGELLILSEQKKARENLERRASTHDLTDEIELLHGLDLGEKYAVLMRHKARMSDAMLRHYTEISKIFGQCISVRNTVMHGRPLTIEDYSRAFALTSELIKYQKYWPHLADSYQKYTRDPASIVEVAVKFLDDFGFEETLNNLPIPDYDDTGFFPRKALEKDLRNKILGRHPVVTVLGDGGDGKSAVTLQTLYGLVANGGHNFEAIIWISAKASRLTTAEIERIETEITSSLAVFGEVSKFFGDISDDPMERVLNLMEANKILLVVDNLETIIDKSIKKFAENIPGESKLLLTSRIPLGSDLSVHVGPFSDADAVSFLRVVINTYDIQALRSESDAQLKMYATRLHNKPLLLKWFALGVSSGLSPSAIVSNPKEALKFCLENVFEALSSSTKGHLAILASLPRPVSLAVMEYVTDSEITQLEANTAELMRYSIIEQVPGGKYEVEFQIKPLAKSYLVRILKMAPKNSDEILRKFRQIEGIFQTERGAQTFNRYAPSSYTVRSKSEALAVKRLKEAVRAAQGDDFQTAFDIIEKLHISHPDYFEVYRVEGYISSISGDNGRAQIAYETALEDGGAHAQLHLFFGQFLLRTFNDYSGALSQFKAALVIDPTGLLPLIEAARTSMYLYDFDGAQHFLDECAGITAKDRKNQSIICDLQLQIHFRRIEYLLQGGDLDRLMPYFPALAEFFADINMDLVDSILISHMRKYGAALTQLQAKCNPEQAAWVKTIVASIQGVLEKLGDSNLNELRESSEEAERKFRVGELKMAGLQASFGFITDIQGLETYVRMKDVNPSVWGSMLKGARVKFEAIVASDGKTRAANVLLL